MFFLCKHSQVQNIGWSILVFLYYFEVLNVWLCLKWTSYFASTFFPFFAVFGVNQLVCLPTKHLLASDCFNLSNKQDA